MNVRSITNGEEFGKGYRGCVGRELAMMEMRAFVVKVLTRFDVNWASSTRPRIANYWMMEYFDFYIKFTKM
jgi:cytochrome P450